MQCEAILKSHKLDIRGYFAGQISACISLTAGALLDGTPVVSSLWRTSEIRAGIILGRILQRDLLDEWECCWRGEDVLGVGAPLLFCAML